MSRRQDMENGREAILKKNDRIFQILKRNNGN